MIDYGYLVITAVILTNVLVFLFLYGIYRELIENYLTTTTRKVLYWLFIALPILYIGFMLSVFVVPDFVYVQCYYWDLCRSIFGGF